MKITYLGHSGFLVETQTSYFLFDYIHGSLPVFDSQKPLYVFVSHSHGDHFRTKIFEDEIANIAAKYFLSNDTMKKLDKLKIEALNILSSKLCRIKAHEETAFDNIKIKALKSTDLGVAFLVTEGETTFFHAGDLNWWHWKSETAAWNKNMEVNYKRQIDLLKEYKIDCAFIPLDPRLEEAYYYGMDYFIKSVEVKKIFPMHFWNDYDIIEKYIDEHGSSEKIVKIKSKEQIFEF